MTTDSSVVGIVDLRRHRRLSSYAIRTDRQRGQCVLSSREKFRASQHAARKPASKIAGEWDPLAADFAPRTATVTPTLRTKARWTYRAQSSRRFAGATSEG